MNREKTALEILNENVEKFGINEEKLNAISQEIRDCEKFLKEHHVQDYTQKGVPLFTDKEDIIYFSWMNGRIFLNCNIFKPFVEHKAKIRINYINFFRNFIKEICDNI